MRAPTPSAVSLMSFSLPPPFSLVLPIELGRSQTSLGSIMYLGSDRPIYRFRGRTIGPNAMTRNVFGLSRSWSSGVDRSQ